MPEKDDISPVEDDHAGLMSAVAPDNQDSVDKGVAKFKIGEAVQHRKFGFQGVIFDVDPEFANSDEWYDSIPADVRPRKDQPFYHLFAVNPADMSPYIAYVSQQNLIPLPEGEEVAHPQLEDYFDGRRDGTWIVPRDRIH